MEEFRECEQAFRISRSSRDTCELSKDFNSVGAYQEIRNTLFSCGFSLKHVSGLFNMAGDTAYWRHTMIGDTVTEDTEDTGLLSNLILT